MADRRTRELRAAAGPLHYPTPFWGPGPACAWPGCTGTAVQKTSGPDGNTYFDGCEKHYAMMQLSPDPRVSARERRLEEPRTPRRYDCGHPRPKSVELKGWYHACVACTRLERSKTRHWLLVGLAAFVLLAVTCTARASDPCAPYTPADGRTCHPPTRLTWIHKKLNPVCTCWPPRVVRSAP